MKTIKDIGHHYEAFEIIIDLADKKFREIYKTLSHDERERYQQAFDIIEDLANEEKKDYINNYH